MTIMNFICFSILFTTLFAFSHGVNFYIKNECSFTVWAAAVPGGGQQLNPGGKWTINVNPGTKMARIWGRTGCRFDSSGHGHCQTGDCNGVLNCQAWGVPPTTLAEYTLNGAGNQDFFDISLIDGFNLPMGFGPTTSCRGISCRADINGQCPNELRTSGGCHNPCTVFKTQQYCCTQGPCGPTSLSRFFKDRCRDAYSYPQDDPTSTFTCPSGVNYKVVFCPRQGASNNFTSLLESVVDEV